MDLLESVWLIALFIFALLHSEFAFRYPHPYHPLDPISQWIIFYFVVGIGFASVVLTSLATAIAIMSVIGLVSGLCAYFLRQRFAFPLDKIGMAKKAPWFLKATALFCFLSSVVWLALDFDWYFGLIPIILWGGLGYLTAEISIRRYSHGTNHDREGTIRAINFAQGRGIDFARYPFP